MEINEIYQVFKDYYEEENVDLIDYNGSTLMLDSYYTEGISHVIIIHWPTVDIVNEANDKITIWDLYAAIPLRENGKLRTRPQFIRSTYNKPQWISCYTHSHIPRLNKRNLREFQGSCLGHGPLNHTIDRLTDSGEDLDIWRLFCWELDKYVHVESLKGGPYIRMREVNSKTSLTGYSYLEIASSISDNYRGFALDLTKEIIKHKILNFGFVDGKYTIAMSYVDLVLAISNLYIELYNNDATLRTTYPKEHLFEDNYLISGAVVDNAFYETCQLSNVTFNTSDIESFLFDFKGKPVNIKFIGKDEAINTITYVNPSIINFIIYNILKYININYGRNTDSTNPTDKKVKDV